ncbi:unnamed protein product [Mytilus edulis]|uniref:Uncharacterized protein n=1 Tax=Mytilus edulis TaxID=6550 RepID=A0A8S3V3V3_MYTED|nr:unnamed protein product [Mytilus edulis]
MYTLSRCEKNICAVEWKIEQKISAYGEDLRLLCIADNYSIDGVKIKRWEGGPKQKMLTLNGAPDQEDVMKYKMSMRQDGFDLVIKNVSKVDLNVTYECTYGFKKSGKVILKIEDAFEVRQIVHVKPSKRESKGNNIVIICVIIVSSLVIAAVSTLILLHKYGKLKELKYICSSNDNSVDRNDGDLPSGRPQETDQLIPQHNGFANHLSNGVGLVEDVPIESTSRTEPVKKPNTAEGGNTELIGETLDGSSLQNVTTLKDFAPATFTEVNEESLLKQEMLVMSTVCYLCKYDRYREDVSDLVSVPPNQSELVTSVTGSKTLEQCNTESDAESVDETSLKDHHAVPASVPEKGFQFTTSVDQETKMHPSDNIKCETRAQCFSCGAKRLWQEGDNPFDEHLHDDCRHLKHIKEKQVCNLHEIPKFLSEITEPVETL